MDFFEKILSFFAKNPNFLKNAEGIKFAVECDWIGKISQRVQNLGFCWKQIRCFIRKKYSCQNRCK